MTQKEYIKRGGGEEEEALLEMSNRAEAMMESMAKAIAEVEERHRVFQREDVGPSGGRELSRRRRG